MGGNDRELSWREMFNLPHSCYVAAKSFIRPISMRPLLIHKLVDFPVPVGILAGSLKRRCLSCSPIDISNRHDYIQPELESFVLPDGSATFDDIFPLMREWCVAEKVGVTSWAPTVGFFMNCDDPSIAATEVPVSPLPSHKDLLLNVGASNPTAMAFSYPEEDSETVADDFYGSCFLAIACCSNVPFFPLPPTSDDLDSTLRIFHVEGSRLGITSATLIGDIELVATPSVTTDESRDTVSPVIALSLHWAPIPGRVLVVHCSDQSLRLFKVHKMSVFAGAVLHGVCSVTAGVNGWVVAYTRGPLTMTDWDLGTRAVIAHFSSFIYPNCMAVTPFDTVVATASDRKTFYIDLQSGTLISDKECAVSGHFHGPARLFCNPDGTVSWIAQQEYRVCGDLELERVTHELEAHSSMSIRDAVPSDTTAVAFSDSVGRVHLISVPYRKRRQLSQLTFVHWTDGLQFNSHLSFLPPKVKESITVTSMAWGHGTFACLLAIGLENGLVRLMSLTSEVNIIPNISEVETVPKSKPKRKSKKSR